MSQRFEMSDLVMLHKIIHSLVPVELPAYLSFYRSGSRLRIDHLDNFCLVSAVLPNTTASQSSTTNTFANSFFYRSHILWNNLPLELRTENCPKNFKKSLKAYLFEKSLQIGTDDSSESDYNIDSE